MSSAQNYLESVGVLWPQRFRTAIERASKARADLDHLGTLIDNPEIKKRLDAVCVELVHLTQFIVTEADAARKVK